MKSRNIIGILLAGITVLSSLLLFVCKHGMVFYGVIGLILGLLGAFFITFPKSVFELWRKLGKSERNNDNTSKCEFWFVNITKITGWILSVIPIVFLWIRTI
ncbi:MAG: hypothetical protein IJX75_04930 [Clostridia bacterium]|nr:hypothetical protein [Clostridia bacterium]